MADEELEFEAARERAENERANKLHRWLHNTKEDE
jgi:hypothetical protein